MWCKLFVYTAAILCGVSFHWKIMGIVSSNGMLLWNRTTAEWDVYLGARFDIASFEDVYYKEYDQYNRMYLLVNP